MFQNTDDSSVKPHPPCVDDFLGRTPTGGHPVTTRKFLKEKAPPAPPHSQKLQTRAAVSNLPPGLRFKGDTKVGNAVVGCQGTSPWLQRAIHADHCSPSRRELGNMEFSPSQVKCNPVSPRLYVSLHKDTACEDAPCATGYCKPSIQPRLFEPHTPW
jgi:hypothetical protein